MVPSSPIPSDASEQAVAIWQDVAESLTIGDIEKLHDAVKDFITLSAKDKKILEDMASILPHPGLPATLITEIFNNPEATVGIIERLGSELTGSKVIDQLGTAEQAIVLDALIAWLKSDQKATISSFIKTDASTIANPSTPLNSALQNYITAAGSSPSAATPVHMGSLQFLKNNAISLAGLNIADPALLNQAYQMASQQLLITLLPEINTSNLPTEAINSSATDTTSQQATSNTIQKRLVDDIRKALQDGAIPLNMQTYLVLWTAITLPSVEQTKQPTENAARNPLIATNTIDPVKTMEATKPIEAVKASETTKAIEGVKASETTKDTDTKKSTSTNQEKTESIDLASETAGAIAAATSAITPLHGIVSATGILPLSPIVASVLASIPSLFNDKSAAPVATPEAVDQLGMLSYIYSQMAPYWSGPAAVSLMAATKGGEMTEQKKLESSVRAFAIALGALLNDPSFDKLLSALLKKTSPTLTEEQLKVFIAAMKISILTNALIALYIVLLRKNQGQFRADELVQLILGPPLDDRIDLDDLQKGIIKSIQTELLHIPVEKRRDFVNNLLSGYNKDTDINSLVDPTKQFLNLCDQTLNLDKTSNTKG